MPTIKFRWKAKRDLKTCPICKALDGYEWTFTTPDPLPTELTHPQFGVVWNLSSGSRAHGHEEYNCRCKLDFNPATDIDFSDLNSFLEQKVKELEAANQ